MKPRVLKQIKFPAIDLGLPKVNEYSLFTQLYLNPKDFSSVLNTSSEEFYEVLVDGIKNDKLNSIDYVLNKPFYIVFLNYISQFKIDNLIKNNIVHDPNLYKTFYMDIASDKYSVEVPLVQDIQYTLDSFIKSHLGLIKIFKNTTHKHLYLTSGHLDAKVKIAWLPPIKSE